MKSKMLLTSLNEVNDEYVEDADASVASMKRFGWAKWAAVAACVLIAFLIAVPALWDKAPEVEHEPVEPTSVEEPVEEPTNEPVDEPVEEPIDEPVDEPIDEPVNEPIEIPISVPVTIPTGSTEGQAGDAFEGFSDTVLSYDEFAVYIEDPLYEAISKSELAQQHELTYLFRAKETFPGTYYTIETGIYLDTSTRLTSLCVERYFSEATYVKDFVSAAENDTLTTYEVDGITVQEIDRPRPTAFNPDEDPFSFSGGDFGGGGANTVRLNIEGEWYYVIGASKSEAKELADELAHIAAEANLTSAYTNNMKGLSVLPSGGRLSIEPAGNHVRTGNEPAGALFNPETDTLSQEDRYADIYAGSNKSIGWPYDVAYSLVITNPVFKALFESPETQEFEIIGVTAGGYYQLATMQATDSSSVSISHNGVAKESTWQGFVLAENNGTRTDYQVDGVWIEKFSIQQIDSSYFYHERVKVAGGWYLVQGFDEASVDAIATALAHIAAQY